MLKENSLGTAQLASKTSSISGKWGKKGSTITRGQGDSVATEIDAVFKQTAHALCDPSKENTSRVLLKKGCCSDNRGRRTCGHCQKRKRERKRNRVWGETSGSRQGRMTHTRGICSSCQIEIAGLSDRRSGGEKSIPGPNLGANPREDFHNKSARVGKGNLTAKDRENKEHESALAVI